MKPEQVTLAALNEMSEPDFVAVCGPCFEHTPWVAAKTFPRRPFGSLHELHAALCDTLWQADRAAQMDLLRAHPDLAGKLSATTPITEDSVQEQASAGLDRLTVDELRQFQELNAEYHRRFPFPFIVCARNTRTSDILMSFAVRVALTVEQEFRTALDEVAQIARWRLWDRVREP